MTDDPDEAVAVEGIWTQAEYQHETVSSSCNIAGCDCMCDVCMPVAPWKLSLTPEARSSRLYEFHREVERIGYRPGFWIPFVGRLMTRRQYELLEALAVVFNRPVDRTEYPVVRMGPLTLSRKYRRP